MSIEVKARNKQIAVEFLQAAAQGRARGAGTGRVSPDFRHHNPFFKGDAETLMTAMDENAAQNPEKSLEILHVIEEGDMVAVHSHVRQKPGDRGGAIVHIF